MLVGELVQNAFHLALEAAPWMVLGLVAAGLIKAWLPQPAIGRRLGGSGIRPVATAAFIGAPLPLCSCGVLPAAFGLHRAGASKGSTVSFLVATPETGVDSIAVSYALLGPFLTVLRPFAAITSAITAGLLVDRTGGGGAAVAAAAPVACCDHRHDHDHSPAAGQEHCHSHDHGHSHGHSHSHATAVPAGGWLRRGGAGLRYAFTGLLDDLAVWLGVGLAAAALVVTLVPPDTLSAWGSGPVAMLLIMVVAVPMYVCATASTPLAHAMLHAGVSPGTVLVFMLAGPAVNFAGLILIKRELGIGALRAYLIGVCGTALLFGLGVDLLVAWASFDLLAGYFHDHDAPGLLPLWISVPALAILVAFAVKPLRRLILDRRLSAEAA